MRKELYYPRSKSFRYTVVPNVVHQPAEEEFAAARKYFESHCEESKFSNAETGAPFFYGDASSSVTLRHSFMLYQYKVYAICVDPKTSSKKLLCRDTEKPDDISQADWEAEFQFADSMLPRDRPNFTKLPKAQKIVTGYSFWKLPSGVYAQMRPRTCLGVGVYGVAKLLVNQQGKKCVVKKQYLISAEDKTAFIEESDFSLKTGLAFDSFIDDKKNKAFLFMNFYPYTLEAYIELLSREMEQYPKDTRKNWESLLNLLIKLIDELNRIHFTHRIIHRDIKMDNIFVTEDGNVKLGDFGLAKPADRKGEYKGSKEWKGVHIAPEALSHGDFSFASDIFAMGLVYKTCFERLKNSSLLSFDLIENDFFHAFIAGVMHGNFRMRLPHQFIASTLSNMLSMVKGEIDLDSFITKSNDLKLALRASQMFGISFDKQHTGEEKLYLDPFLKEQFLSVNFERDFFITDEISAQIKAIFLRYYDALKYTQDHEIVRTEGLFTDRVLAQKERCEEIKQEISASDLFGSENREPITAEKLSALLSEVDNISLGRKKPVAEPANSFCSVS